MTDLSSYDAAIVKAAEDLVRTLRHRTSLGLEGIQLVDAVMAKRGAQAPTCTILGCANRAVQCIDANIGAHTLASSMYRCERHRIMVTEL